HKNSLDILQNFAKARKLIGKKNELNLEKASKILIKEFREGKFGKIILDKNYNAL
ncbi:ribosome biogenesis GTPase YlqF, partial [Borreliella americana]|nr:ribosome biogenesis GTPase YlqF [Borreliella americana]